MTKEERDEKARKALFVPCDSMERLHAWIKFFLRIDFPHCRVDPESNSSPMEMIWEVYSNALANKGATFNRVMYYASRDSYKTLGAAVLELLVLLHMSRDVAHMAAIEAQSDKAQSYVKKFMGYPYLRDYLVGDSQKTTVVARFNDPRTGKNLTEEEWKELPRDERDSYTEIRNYIKVVICTMQGANSDHVPFFVIDEVDVVTNPAAYEEAKAIPAPYNGIFPITMLISTRKISTGLVQKEIDEAVDADGNVKLQIRHWNIIDVTQACPKERHLPERKKLPIYVDDNELRALSEKKYNDLSPEQKLKFKKEEGYAGCIENCKLFAACKGRLATEQKSTSKLLRPIDHVVNQIGTASVPFALAQYLCRKPSTEGLIYPNLERETHVISAAEMAEMLTGTPFPKTMSKVELLALVLARGCAFFSGMDFGFKHNFAVVTGFVDGQRAFIVDVISQKDLMPDEQIKVCQDQIRSLVPAIYADPENAQLVELFRKNGFRMRDWKKTPGSLTGGIDIVRMRLRPPMGDPLIFFLRGDPMVDLLVKRMMKYHWKVDAAGRLTNVPNDADDDECDAIRYLVMNVFPAHGRKARIAEDSVTQSTISTGEPVYTKENWIKEWLAAHGITDHEDGTVSGKKGRFAFIM